MVINLAFLLLFGTMLALLCSLLALASNLFAERWRAVAIDLVFIGVFVALSTLVSQL